MGSSAFAHAFARAGYDVHAPRLATAANNALRSANGNFGRAMAQFIETLQGDVLLLGALATPYLGDRAADMSGQSLIGGGQSPRAMRGQGRGAPAGQSLGDDGGQSSIASAIEKVPPSSPPEAERGGHDSIASASASVPPRSAPVHDGEGQRWSVPQPGYSPAIVKPTSPPASAVEARLKAAQMVATTVMDTYKVRGGIAIGDLGWQEAKTLARTNEREARVLRYITDHVANANPGARIREVVKEQVVQNAIRLATEADNVAA